MGQVAVQEEVQVEEEVQEAQVTDRPGEYGITATHLVP